MAIRGYRKSGKAFGFVVLVNIVGALECSWRMLDFDTAMQLQSFTTAILVTKRISGIDGAELYNKFKNLYDQYNLSVVMPDRQTRIPKTIHQVWLGSPLPKEFKSFIASWLDYHPDWQYKLWTDNDVACMKLENQKYYDQAENYGAKSDILRWEILRKYGGVYVDMDAECLQSLDELNHTYDFYIGIQPLDTQFLQLGIGLVGAIPNHPIIEHTIKTIKDDWHHKGAPTKTGPVHFTKSFFAMAGKDGLRDIALPAYYFYPMGCLQTELKRSEWTSKGAYSVHHWAKSWMPPSYRKQDFKGISNAQSEKCWND